MLCPLSLMQRKFSIHLGYPCYAWQPKINSIATRLVIETEFNRHNFESPQLVTKLFFGLFNKKIGQTKTTLGNCSKFFNHAIKSSHESNDSKKFGHYLKFWFLTWAIEKIRSPFLVMTVGDHKFGDRIFWTMFKSFWATTNFFFNHWIDGCSWLDDWKKFEQLPKGFGLFENFLK